MKKTVEKKITEVIITKDDLFRTLRLLYSEYENAEVKNRSFRVMVKCENDESYEFEDGMISYDETVLDTQRALSIEITFRERKYDQNSEKRIFLDINQNNSYRSYYQIESTDENRVNSQYKKITDIIDSFKPQNNLFEKYRNIFLFGGLSFFTFFFSSFLIYIFIKASGYNILNLGGKYDLFTIMILIIAGGLMSVIMMYEIYKSLKELRPSIEFDFGPDHKKYSKNRRKFIWKLSSVIIIPIVITILQLLLS